MTLGQRISQHRKALGISQEELGERLGVSRQAVSKWETDASSPDMENLLALAREFGVSVAELTGTPEEAPVCSHPSFRALFPILCGFLGAALIGLLILFLEQPPSSQPASPPPVSLPGTDFTLVWTNTSGQEEQLSLGSYSTEFPFGTTLEAEGPGSVTVSKKGSLDLRTYSVSCGSLSLQYSETAEPSGSPFGSTLQMMETASRDYRTPRGIGVGSTGTEMIQAYEEAGLIYCTGEYGPDTSLPYEDFYIFSPPDESNPGFGFNLIFLMSGNHVTGIRMEDASYPFYNINNCDSFPVRNGAPDFSDRIQRPVSTEQQVYDALNALITRTDLTAEELHTHRNTVFGSLQDLGWQAFGALGVTEHPEDTMETLLSWLHEQAPWSEAEISCLQRGIQSKPDGFLAEGYSHLLCKAFFSNPTVFVRHLALNEDCAEGVIASVAFDAVWYPGELDAALEALHTSSFSQVEAAWYQRLLETLKEYNVFTA